jgi:hypothetical protein
MGRGGGFTCGDWHFVAAYHWPEMISPRFQTLLVWLVLSAQAVAAIGSPVGLLTCQKTDGSTHIEWVRLDCNKPQADIAEPATDSIHEPCSFSSCVDQPIGFDPALTQANMRGQKLVATASIFLDLPRAVFVDTGSPATWLVSTVGVDPGPPEQSRLSLGAVVLIL